MIIPTDKIKKAIDEGTAIKMTYIGDPKYVIAFAGIEVKDFYQIDGNIYFCDNTGDWKWWSSSKDANFIPTMRFDSFKKEVISNKTDLLDKLFIIMKDYEKFKVYGKIKLILLSDSSGYFYFEGVNVQIKFKNLEDAPIQWYKIFSYKD